MSDEEMGPYPDAAQGEMPTPGSLNSRIQQLRQEALHDIKDAQRDKMQAQKDYADAERREREAVKAAIQVGWKRKELGEQLGTSASWVSNLARDRG